MDDFSIKQPSAFSLIRILFIFVAATFLTFFILLFALNINEIAKATSGEIISDNPPREYIAPFDAKAPRIFVTEGDTIKNGDTLIILYNEELQSNADKVQKELALTDENIKIYRQLLDNLLAKISYQHKKEIGIKSTYGFKDKTSLLELSALESQMQNEKNKLDVAKDRLQKDHQLLLEGAISEQEYGNEYKSFLDLSKSYSESQKRYRQQLNEKESLFNSLSNEINDQKLRTLSSEFEILNLEKMLAQEEIKQLQLRNEKTFFNNELNKQYLISQVNGIVSNLFNVKADLNYVTKGKSLIIISPLEEQKFYAKLFVSERSIRNVKKGQAAHIKLDAYNYYQYGLLKGKVTHIDKELTPNAGESDSKPAFFVIAEITEENTQFDLKSGYSIRGEIIKDRMKLYEFMFRKIFKKVNFG